ncbi:MAG: bifunctional glutamate N-acetyltransferase/amino-acid acetyltransferase ArgJ [Gammaproteobacteria bacterium]
MPVKLEPAGTLLPIPGIRLASTSAGIYRKTREDLVLLEIAEHGSVSAVFTQNSFSAAPVTIARRHIRHSYQRYCLINAGNANAGTGQQGITDALQTCTKLAQLGACPVEAVLPFSTGVIGQDLPVDKITSALPELIDNLSEDNWNRCATAIMTTDIVSKGISRQIVLDGKQVTITGIAKGSGMIRPDMATMLAFVGTDAVIENNILDDLLGNAVAASFNRICVDGDTSTNDACVLIATGKSGHKRINSSDSENYRKLQDAVTEVCTHLATAVVRDGEGATKFISVCIEGGQTSQECLDTAYAIATSPLVKTAFFASDPNWGRILAAVGRAGLADLDVNGISIYLNDCRIVSNGCRSPEYTEEAGQEVMDEDEIILRVDLGRGKYTETVWTCDLSHEYVRINAEYRS